MPLMCDNEIHLVKNRSINKYVTRRINKSLKSKKSNGFFIYFLIFYKFRWSCTYLQKFFKSLYYRNIDESDKPFENNTSCFLYKNSILITL